MNDKATIKIICIYIKFYKEYFKIYINNLLEVIYIYLKSSKIYK